MPQAVAVSLPVTLSTWASGGVPSQCVRLACFFCATQKAKVISKRSTAAPCAPLFLVAAATGAFCCCCCSSNSQSQRLQLTAPQLLLLLLLLMRLIMRRMLPRCLGQYTKGQAATVEAMFLATCNSNCCCCRCCCCLFTLALLCFFLFH